MEDNKVPYFDTSQVDALMAAEYVDEKPTKIPDCVSQLSNESEKDFESRIESLGYVKVICILCGSVFWDVKDGNEDTCEDCWSEV